MVRMVVYNRRADELVIHFRTSARCGNRRIRATKKVKFLKNRACVCGGWLSYYLRDKFPRNLDSIDPFEGVALILALFTSLMTNAMRLRWEVGDLK